MHRLEMLPEPVGRAELLKTIKAEWEGDQSGVEETAATCSASPFHHRLCGQEAWATLLPGLGDTMCSLKNISWMVP